MTTLNASWYVDNDPSKGLNPRIRLINTNTDEENIELLTCISIVIKLVDPNENDRYLMREKLVHRCELAKALDNNFDLETFDTSLKGFGTLKDHQLYNDIYTKYVKISAIPV